MTPENRATAIVSEPLWVSSEGMWRVNMQSTPDGHELRTCVVYYGAIESDARRASAQARGVIAAAIEATGRAVHPVHTRLEGVFGQLSSV